MALITKYKKYLRMMGFIWASCLVIFVLAYFLVMSPQNKTRNEIERDLAESKQEYESARQAAREETTRRLKEEIGLLQDKLDMFVLDFKSAEDLTFDISRIAGESKVSSFNIRNDDIRASSASVDPNNIFEKHINVSFIAGFREFALFLNSLERHQPVLFIDAFTLSRQNNDKTTYQVSLDIAALVRKQQTAKTDDQDVEKIVGAKF
ncbi:MAG: hypothetical protein P8016_00450 [Sedimentisphaerales bacterium]